ncbi:MAG: TatD family hydrolase [Deltaproteobacteria bacterium]|nr:TatD family hydrolase [Deltaproteobacteria bacterium]MBW2086302.1 TatD family hydrolase [Deltaproteobacteria bacterium]
MNLIDSHAHLDLKEFDSDRKDVLKRAKEAGLVHIITIGINVESSARAIDLAAKNDFISATVGFHPHDAKSLTPAGLDRLRDLGRSEQVVGFGEIGLDFFRNLSPHHLQEKAFDDLIHLGLELDLPLIIHDREAHQKIYSHLSAVRSSLKRGVIHCFSGDYNLARRFLDLGFHLSIPGTITFPKAETLRRVVAKVPLESILLETDCPFLAPAPKRGKRNEPALIRFTAAELARIKGVSVEEVAAITTAAVRSLFKLPEPPRSGL